MGTDVHVVVVGGRPGLVEGSVGFVADLERRWSRFQRTSEISLMNDCAGSPVTVSGETLGLVERALEGAHVTDGRYDPTVLGAVLRAGYDRSFELMQEATAGSGSTLASGWDRIAIDRTASTVTLPAGVGFDPGGIGKGYAADLLVGELVANGASGACASLGGDLRAEGEAPGAGPWTIAIDHPLRAEPAAVIGLGAGAVATSSRARRTWGAKGHERHHLIDPATGQPAASGLLSATAVAAEAWRAEVLAKAAFIQGFPRGLEVLTSIGAAGVVVDDDGAVHESLGMTAFTGRTASVEAVAEPASAGTGPR